MLVGSLTSINPPDKTPSMLFMSFQWWLAVWLLYYHSPTNVNQWFRLWFHVDPFQFPNKNVLQILAAQINLGIVYEGTMRWLWIQPPLQWLIPLWGPNMNPRLFLFFQGNGYQSLVTISNTKCWSWYYSLERSWHESWTIYLPPW